MLHEFIGFILGLYSLSSLNHLMLSHNIVGASISCSGAAYLSCFSQSMGTRRLITEVVFWNNDTSKGYI